MSLFDFLRTVRPKRTEEFYNNLLFEFHANAETKLSDIFKTNWSCGIRLSYLLAERFLIVGYYKNGKKINTKIIYDSRFYDVITLKNCSIWLLKKHKFYKIPNEQYLKPLPNISNSNCKQEHLWEILKLTLPLPNPISIVNLPHWLKTNALYYPKKIILFYVMTYHKNCERGYYDNVEYGDSEAEEKITIEIVCDRYFQLAFCKKSPEHPNEVQKNKEDLNLYNDCINSRLLTFPESKMNASNRSCSVHIEMPVLSFAFQLGVLDITNSSKVIEMKRYCKELCKTVMTIVCTYDKGKHLRLVQWKDCYKKYLVELPCFDGKNNNATFNYINKKEAFGSMNVFFEKMFERQVFWQNYRQYILKDIVENLKKYPLDVSSPFKKCYLNLLNTIKSQMVVCFSKDDQDLQHLKFYLANYINTKFNNRKRISIRIRTRTDNTMIALCTLNMTIFNLHEYFNCSFQDFYGPNEQESLSIKCHKMLKHQKKPESKLFCSQRSCRLATMLMSAYINLRLFLQEEFGMDCLANNTFKSLSRVGYEIVMIKSAESIGPFEIGLEQTKHFYEDLFRNYSFGGFMYSSFCELKSGDLLCENGPTVKSLHHYDLNSSYGFTASKMHFPNAFAIGFVKSNFSISLANSSKEGNNKKINEIKEQNEFCYRQDRCRFKSFEFRCTYFTIYKLLEKGVSIQIVFHNYTTNGIFSIKNYPLDLAVISTAGQLMLYNFDSQYCHSCPQNCKLLKHYANNQSPEELQNKSTLRDQEILNFVHSHPNATYEVFHDCHSPNYRPTELNYAFQTIDVLKNICKHYPKEVSFSSESFLKFVQLNKHNNNFTYFCWVKCQTKDPLLIVEHKILPYNHLLMNHTNNQPILLTREYLEFLLTKNLVHISDLYAVIFYQTRPCMNSVYKTMIDARLQTTNAALNSLLKQMINLSCGIFGMKYRQQSKIEVTNALPRRYTPLKHQIDFNILEDSHMSIEKNQYFILVTQKLAKLKKRPQNKMPLPFYAGIVENSKLRLIECLYFFQTHFGFDNIKLIYSNVDNLVLALCNDTLEEGVLPSQQESFIANIMNFISKDKTPGLLKNVYTLDSNQNWKLVTARVQHLIVISNDHYNKTSSFNFQNQEEAYNIGIKMLKGIKTTLSQTKRVNKLTSLETKEVSIIV